ncbi:hypothetical protein DSO57_1029021 [Entomophthora muscae]|nr:hypothetical protein DSO57_1029021 [Entomophthora muscae]
MDFYPNQQLAFTNASMFPMHSVAAEVMSGVKEEPALAAGYFGQPQFYPLANDPFPPLVASQQHKPKPFLMAPQYAKPAGQPLRGNQERDYYITLQLEPRSSDPPKHTYATLLAYAILHSPEEKMTLDQIYNWLLEHYPYFETCEKDWRNSIRHNLSLNVMFERVPRHINELGKGSYWTCRPENAKKPDPNDSIYSRNPRRVRKVRNSPRPSFFSQPQDPFMAQYQTFPLQTKAQRASLPPIQYQNQLITNDAFQQSYPYQTNYAYPTQNYYPSTTADQYSYLPPTPVSNNW